MYLAVFEKGFTERHTNEETGGSEKINSFCQCCLTNQQSPSKCILKLLSAYRNNFIKTVASNWMVCVILVILFNLRRLIKLHIEFLSIVYLTN